MFFVGGFEAMRLLIFTTWYNVDEEDGNLITDLAIQFARLGHDVRVVALEWNRKSELPATRVRQPSGVDALLLSPSSFAAFGRAFSLLYKWVFSSVVAVRPVREFMKGHDVDLIVAFAPLTILAAPLVWALQKYNCSSYVYVTDMFPFHHRSLGVIRSPIAFEVAAWIEGFLLRRFKSIGCMSAANISYLKSHYRLCESQHLGILRLWGASHTPPRANREVLRAHFLIPQDRTVAIYGGKMSEAQGISDIIEAARLAAESRPDILFILAGHGRLEPLVHAYIDGGGKNLIHIKRLDRSQYIELVSACDVGLIATFAEVDVPTFPHKIIDYLRAGVPLAASVEQSTDFGEFVMHKGIGIAVVAGHPEQFLSAICQIVDDPDRAAEMRKSGSRVLNEEFSVETAVNTLLAQAKSLSDTRPVNS